LSGVLLQLPLGPRPCQAGHGKPLSGWALVIRQQCCPQVLEEPVAGVTAQLPPHPLRAQKDGLLERDQRAIGELGEAAVGGEPVGLACRVYRTPEGLGGSPTVEQLVEVLS
jgi:hypothetical protein